MKTSKKKMHFRIGEKEKEVIKLVGLGALVVASFAVPNLPIAIKQINDIRGSKGLKKFFQNLERKNIINLGEERIVLTKKGKDLLKLISLEDINISPKKDWDGIWWLVSYDVPKKYNLARDLFRYYLKRIGFYQIQDSLWVFPYNCKEEIAIIARELEINNFVIIMETDHLPNQEDMIEHYNL